MNNLPMLDTEEKLREYIRKEWRGNYEPYQVDAFVINADSVLIKKSKETDLQNTPTYSVGRGRIIVSSERIVNSCVLSVLEEAYRKYDDETKRKMQEHLKYKAMIEDSWKEASSRAQCLEQENAYHQRSLEQMARKADMTPDRFMNVKQGLEKKLKHPSLLTRILNLFK